MSSEEQDLDALEALRSWREPPGLHPIAEQASRIYLAHGSQLPDEAIDELRDLIDGYGQSGEDLAALGAAIEGLARFVILLNEVIKDPVSGRRAFALGREYRASFEPFWQRAREAMAKLGTQLRGAYVEFFDLEASSDKKAPSFGAPAPKGTIPLRALAPPGQPPPWATKRKVR